LSSAALRRKLHAAIASSSAENVIRVLMNGSGSEINAAAEPPNDAAIAGQPFWLLGETALHVAVLREDVEAVRNLLDQVLTGTEAQHLACRVVLAHRRASADGGKEPGALVVWECCCGPACEPTSAHPHP